MVRLACLCLALCSACTPADRWTRVELALDGDGELRLLTRRETYKEGVRTDFLYGEQQGGAWELEWIEVGGDDHEGGGYYGVDAGVYSLLVDGERAFAVVDLPSGIDVYARDGEDWALAPRTGGLPAGAVEAMRTHGVLGGAWLGSDGEVRLLADEWLVELRDGRLDAAAATGAACTPAVEGWIDGGDREECHLVPGADRAAESVSLEPIAPTGAVQTTVRRLVCAEACAWEPLPEMGLEVSGGLANGWEDIVVFRTSDGTLRLAQYDYPGARVTGAGESRFYSVDTFQLGAVARPSGGYVLATHGYDDALVLTAVDAAGDARRFDLDVVRARTASGRVGVIVAPATSERAELAHVVVPTTSSTFLHVSVDLSSGATQRESIGW